MYWPSEVDMPEEDDSEDEEDAAEEAADEENNVEDGDESESEDEEDALNKTNDEAENEEEAKESRFKIDSVAFRRIADAVVEPQEDEEEVDDENDEEDAGDDEEEDENEWAIQENALDAMQASAEEFTSHRICFEDGTTLRSRRDYTCRSQVRAHFVAEHPWRQRHYEANSHLRDLLFHVSLYFVVLTTNIVVLHKHVFQKNLCACLIKLN
jgi:hypothetical protein